MHEQTRRATHIATLWSEKPATKARRAPTHQAWRACKTECCEM